MRIRLADLLKRLSEPKQGKKYKLTSERRHFGSTVVYRIEYLTDIEGTPIKKGMKGGFLEGYANLGQDGTCCVLDNAVAVGSTVITGDAVIKDNSVVVDSHISGSVTIGGTVRVQQSTITGKSSIIANIPLIQMRIGLGDRSASTISGQAPS